MMLLFLAFFLSPDFETDFIFLNNIKLLNLLTPGFCCCNNSVNYCQFQVDLCVLTMNQELIVQFDEKCILFFVKNLMFYDGR